MNDKQGADDSANMTVEYSDWHYEQALARNVEPPPSQQVDPFLYRMVVGFLGAAMMTAILLVGLLSYQGKSGSDLLIAIPSGVVGGLIGMLVPSPARK